jgi:hypothetical protein
LYDLAYALAYTNSEFNVTITENEDTIDISSGTSYSKVAEMPDQGDINATAMISTNKVFLNGKEQKLTVYNIGEKDYFNLFEIGQALKFVSKWDDTNNIVAISTNDANSINDMNSAELYYTSLEADLQMRIHNVKSDMPGYDEYRYNVDEIIHDPYEFKAYLMSVYGNF